MKLCGNCTNQNNGEHCCTDIYNKTGQTKGPSITGDILAAFVMPALVFIGSLILSEYLLSAYIFKSNLKAIFTFLIALGMTVAFVELMRIFMKKAQKYIHNNNAIMS